MKLSDVRNGPTWMLWILIVVFYCIYSFNLWTWKFSYIRLQYC